jgi:hypothetical protein
VETTAPDNQEAEASRRLVRLLAIPPKEMIFNVYYS